MATYGLGGFMYDVTVDGKATNFKFYDPEDATNVTETSVTAEDMPEGREYPDNRDTAEIAFAKVSKELNEKRTARLVERHTEALADSLERSNALAQTQSDFIANSEDGSVKPVKVEKDGTRVYNTGGDPAPTKTTDTDAKKK